MAVRDELTAKIDGARKRQSTPRQQDRRQDGRIPQAVPRGNQRARRLTWPPPPGYRELHARLVDDDLPRFQEQFKRYLNQNTIRDIAGFQSQLNKQAELIRDRVDVINESLADVDYNPGRFIRLEAQPTPDTDIRDFRADLRACTDDAVSGDVSDQYSEQKFLQVSRIIERFRGREGQTEADRGWTRRVTDVRNWFIFSASERWREDDTEHEHYADSGGKSGGQKEKLAYTILAASLAYQFKLERGTGRSKTFRFAVIDEAFGRGSDESAQFGLELFRRLGLQLLVVTPLQKIHVIEPYVSAVGFRRQPGRTVFAPAHADRRGVPGAADRPGRAREGDRPQRARALGGRELEVPPVAWTRPDDVRAALRRKWQSGALLTAFADGADWEPLGFPLRGPGPGEIGGRLGEVQDWAGEWERARLGELRVEYKKVGGRHVGSNLIPGRAWIDSYDAGVAAARRAGRGAPVHRAGRSRRGKAAPGWFPGWAATP